MVDYSLIIPEALRALMWPAFQFYASEAGVPSSGAEFDRWALTKLTEQILPIANQELALRFFAAVPQPPPLP